MSEYAFNAFPLMRLAAKGDVEAMRDIACKGTLYAVDAQSEPCMIAALTFARLAYYGTGSERDAANLVQILALAGQLFGPSELQDETRAEAIAVLDTLDDGNELISRGLLELIEETPRDVVALAKDVSQLMKEGA